MPPHTATPDAEAITRQSGSSFTPAFLLLPRDRRRDMATFYAFCRVVDDIADEPGLPVAEKQRQLAEWRRALREPLQEPLREPSQPIVIPTSTAPPSATPPSTEPLSTTPAEAPPREPPLAPAMRGLMAKYGIAPELAEEIVLGCAMDCGAAPVRYATWEDLRRYCYRVASAVGLVSIRIFGAKDPATREYAVELGYALQLTNILRDVAKDLANDRRIYLPQEDLARFGLTGGDLHALLAAEPPVEAEVSTEPPAGAPSRADLAARFQSLMRFEAARAETLYARAVAALPRADARAMAAAELMRRVYHRLLRKMRRDGFRVFEKAAGAQERRGCQEQRGCQERREYRLSKPEKIAALLATLWGKFWAC